MMCCLISSIEMPNSLPPAKSCASPRSLPSSASICLSMRESLSQKRNDLLRRPFVLLSSNNHTHLRQYLRERDFDDPLTRGLFYRILGKTFCNGPPCISDSFHIRLAPTSPKSHTVDCRLCKNPCPIPIRLAHYLARLNFHPPCRRHHNFERSSCQLPSLHWRDKKWHLQRRALRR